MLQPLHSYGAILNLDIIDFRNIKKLIDELVAAIKIAATTLELDKENFIKLVELSLEGSVKIGWDNISEDTKASILAGDSKGAIADRLGRENQASQGKGGSKIVTPTPGVPRELFPGEDHGGPSPKPKHRNLNTKQDQRGLQPKDLDE
ncbi:UNVERIFIED_CONTAM: hypothetical protein Sindi_0065100 [Sesamum indicum]